MFNLSPLTNFKKLDSNYCINYVTTGHRRKIQKVKLVEIKFPIELSNFYLTKTFFVLNYFYPIKSQLS